MFYEILSLPKFYSFEFRVKVISEISSATRKTCLSMSITYFMKYFSLPCPFRRQTYSETGFSDFETRMSCLLIYLTKVKRKLRLKAHPKEMRNKKTQRRVCALWHG